VVDVAAGTTLFTSLDEHMVAPLEGQFAQLPKGHYQHSAKPSANVTRVKLSPAGNRAATTGADHAVRVWDTDTGESPH
jgi:WD40 repeat protein